MEKIRIQDDLYTYVNQAKLEELVIPDDMPVAGGFAALGLDVEKLMIGEFNTMCKEKAYPNAYLESACKLYMLAKDVKRKKKHDQARTEESGHSKEAGYSAWLQSPPEGAALQEH